MAGKCGFRLFLQKKPFALTLPHFAYPEGGLWPLTLECFTHCPLSLPLDSSPTRHSASRRMGVLLRKIHVNSLRPMPAGFECFEGANLRQFASNFWKFLHSFECSTVNFKPKGCIKVSFESCSVALSNDIKKSMDS